MQIKESKKHVQETKKQNMILSDEAVKLKVKKIPSLFEIIFWKQKKNNE